MKTETIEKTLRDLFEKNRIVFWYDDKKELRETFEAITLQDVEKIEMQGNEFYVKHKLLLEEPSQKFLVYQEGEKPPADENWMLDLIYCCGEFRTDKCYLVLHELELNPSFSELYYQHETFFNKENISKLKEKLKNYRSCDEVLSQNKVLMLMLSVCVKSENAKLDTIVHELFKECSVGKSTKYVAIEKASLTDFLWDEISQAYGYETTVPRIKDFVYHLYITTFKRGIGEKSDLKQDSVALLNSFRDSSKYKEAFKKLAKQCSKAMNFNQLIQNIPMENLGKLDYCEDIDVFILQNLLEQMKNETLPVAKLKEILQARRSSVWYSAFESDYKALEAAGEFFDLLHSLNFKCSSFENGIENYSNAWYKLDMYYRLYQFHVKYIDKDGFSELTKKVENFYINRYLIPVNESWQKQIDAVEKWNGSFQYPLQNDFYSTFVESEFSSVRNLKHLVVIVSDALRYEVGWDLYNKATMLDKVKASISPMVSMLPSYTQLGMASLLPGKSLEIDSKGNVLRDNKTTSGKENRKNILETVDGSAIKAEEFLGFNSKERKEFLSKYRVVYIYQNKIDSIGHKKDSELQAFEACNDTVEQLLTMVRKLITANRSNIIVTADHGFLYQTKELDEADFNTETPSEPATFYKDRRFIIAPSISKSSSINVFTTSQLGLQGNYEVAFPKSITRFRLHGACSRFVHGGTSLQEVVIPVVKINYNTKREGASEVEYKLDASTSSIISTSVLALSFSQTEAISPTIKPVQIRVELVAQNGDVISDSHNVIFDSTSEQFSQRRKKVSLTLSSDADKYNNQTIYVVVRKNVPNTSQYVEEFRVSYTLKRTFTLDF